MTLGEWKVEISGRIDGISIDREQKRIVLEEVKSIHFDLELDALYRSARLQRYLFQLMLYALFLSAKEEFADFAFLPQLVLIDLVTERPHVIDAPFDRETVATALHDNITRLVEESEAARGLRMAKRAFAEGLAFPFEEPRPFQHEMIDAVGRAVRQRETLLISAPTGVGKTMAALYPTVVEGLKRGKKIFFLTSKTLQQEMAVEALDMLNDGSFRVLRLRAKQKMCAHTEVICHEDFCPYAAQYSEKMQRNNLLTRITTDHNYFDPDLTFELAKSEEVCPFEVSLELIDEADIVICDYNYIFDPYVRLKRYAEDDDYGDCILLIDEAHNLVDRGRGYYSPELSETMLNDVRWHLAGRPGCNLEGWEDLVDELRQEFALMAEELEGGEGAQGECELRKRFWVNQRTEWERLILRYIAWKIEYKIAEEEDPFVDFYFKLMKFSNLVADDGEEFAHIIERTADGLKLKVFCKDAARFIGEVIDSTYATIAMSATLQPFDFYRTTLGFPSKRASELALPSPFPKENRKIVVIPEVDTTYKSREQHYGRIAQLVAEMSGSIEGNVLALFPSYAFLDQVASRFDSAEKNLLVQRPSMTEFERTSFLDILKRTSSRGTLIMAVSGGMYAEGIDYRGEMLSGVFVIGPALPGVSFEQELLKRYYDDQYGSGFEYAYLIPGMTRVVQSAGRVIRSESDVGVIALLCKRFTQESYTRYFPADWFESSPRELVSKKPTSEIRNFFEEKKRGPQLSLKW
jgi:DNA excision repair protein ERCC-2